MHRNDTRPRRADRRRARRHGGARGFALWQLAVLLAVLGVVLVAGVSLLQGMQGRQRQDDRSALLAAADQALASFALANGRLPCPDSSGSGVEDCSGSQQKGWLPGVTLGLDASAPARGALRLKYIVYRAAGNDLAVQAARFEPSHWGAYYTGASDPTFDFRQQGLPDLCVGLALAAGASASSANAYVQDGAGGALNVAYALAEPGQKRDADGSWFESALNGNDALPGLSPPARAADAEYDNRVQARSFTNLAEQLNCAPLTRGLDAMGQMVDVVAEVASQKEWSKNHAIAMGAGAAIGVISASIKVYLGVGKLAAATAAMAVAAAGLATNAALCAAIITAPVGCPLAAIYGTAVGLAAAAEISAGVAIGLNAAALVLNGLLVADATVIGLRAQAAGNNSAPTSLTELLATLLKAKNDAIAKLASDQAAASAARNAANGGQGVYDSAVTALLALSHAVDKDASNDPALNAALADYISYSAKRQAYYDADGAAKAKRMQASATVGAAATALAAYQAAAAISPQTPAGLVAATQAAAAAAVSAASAASAAAAADPANVALITAATDASVASASATADASDAVSNPSGYVANKLALANARRDDAAKLADEATAQEANVEQLRLATDALLASYNGDVHTVLSSPDYFVIDGNCPIFQPLCIYVDKMATGFTNVKDRYDDFISKNAAALNLEEAAQKSEESVRAATSAYASLAAVTNAAPGTALPITIIGGADTILSAADAAGGSK